MPENKPVLHFVTLHRVECDGVSYPPNSPFESSDEAIIAHLRANKAIALREELAQAEDLAVKLARLEAERVSMLDEIERLRKEREADLSASAASASAEPEAPEAPSAARGRKASA